MKVPGDITIILQNGIKMIELAFSAISFVRSAYGPCSMPTLVAFLRKFTDAVASLKVNSTWASHALSWLRNLAHEYSTFTRKFNSTLFIAIIFEALTLMLSLQISSFIRFSFYISVTLYIMTMF